MDGSQEFTAPSLLQLPDDCILLIFAFAGSAHDIVALRLTCHRLDILSRSQIVWRTLLQRLQSTLQLPKFFPKDLEAPAEELERLSIARHRLKTNLKHGKLDSHVVKKMEWVPSRLESDSSQEGSPSKEDCETTYIHVKRMERIGTAAWISPGWLFTSSCYAFGGLANLSLWDTGHTSISNALSKPEAQWFPPDVIGNWAPSNIYVSREQVDENAYLVLASSWSETMFSLFEVSLPLEEGDQPAIREAGTLSMAYVRGAIATDIRAGYVALLSDIPNSCYVTLWDWKNQTYLSFNVQSQFDNDKIDLQAFAYDGVGPIVVAPPYVVFVQITSMTVHVVCIPAQPREPVPNDTIIHPVVSIPSWSSALPWTLSDVKGMRATLLEHDEQNQTLSIRFDLIKSRRHSQCTLTVFPGECTQRIRDRHRKVATDFQFDFDAKVENIRDGPNQLSIGKCGIRGSTGWFSTLSPPELDVLLRKVLKLPEFSSSDSEDGVDRRIYCPEDRVGERVAIDPFLGRVLVVGNDLKSNGGVYLVDVQ